MIERPEASVSREVERRAELAMQVLRESREMPDGCILYRGPTDASGFGRFRYQGRIYSPHRIILEQVLGRELGRGESWKQTCTHRTCVSPLHLQLERRASPRGPKQRVKRRPRSHASLAELIGQLDLMLHKLRQASELVNKRVRRKTKPLQQSRRPKKGAAAKKKSTKPKQVVSKNFGRTRAVVVDDMSRGGVREFSAYTSFAVLQRVLEFCGIPSRGFAAA